MGKNEDLKEIIEDLELLFKQERITAEEFDGFVSKLKSDAVKQYLKDLQSGSKPERALKDVFFGHGSEFVKLFGKASPEVFRVEAGFIDYVIEGAGGGKAISVEIKPPFVADFTEERGGRRIFKSIKKQALDYKKHDEQIKKYLRVEGEYLIFTNLEKWCFFSDSYSRAVTKPYTELSFSDFIAEFTQIGDLYKFADRKEELSIKEPLDEEFFKSLDTWVKELKKVEYTVDDKTRDALIINLINKLIFIQCLDKLWVGPNKYFERNWSRLESEWAGRKKEILDEFLRRTDNYFYKIYDTELFREFDDKTIFDFIKKDEENIEEFYKKLKLVLGVEFAAWHIGWVNGIIQYNFRFIDEDILGKAYEKYLAEIRKEEGVFYTPKYITQYIVENTVGKKYDDLLSKIKDSFKKENYDDVAAFIKEFISLKVLDPACGSGSFLIKALRVIWTKYQELIELLDENIKELNSFNGTLSRSKEDEEKSKKLIRLKKLINFESQRDLISKIILRHIHGNDLDNRALEVAKVNIWLEGIKLSPTEFRFDRLPKDTNHILPDLEMNLGNGDSVVGLPDNNVIEFLKENHKDDIKKLFELRQKYLNDPSNEAPIREINEIKENLRNKLNEEFQEYLKDEDLPTEIFGKTIPFHWANNFWYVYFNEEGVPRDQNERGFDFVIGNPPYVRIQILNRHIPEYVTFLNRQFNCAYMNYDLAVIFTEKGFDLLKKDGIFGYIETKKWMDTAYGEKLREFLRSKKAINCIIDFGFEQVFKEATTYTILLFLRKIENKNIRYALIKTLEENIEQLNKVKEFEKEYSDNSIEAKMVKYSSLGEKSVWSFSGVIEEKILQKLYTQPKLSEICDLFVGTQTSADKVYVVELLEKKNNDIEVYSRSKDKTYVLEKEPFKEVLKGENITKWYLKSSDLLVLTPYKIINKEGEKKVQLIPEQILKEKYPKTWSYLEDNRTTLKNRENGRLEGKDDWYGYIYLKNLDKFDEPKIIVQEIASNATYLIDDEGKYTFVCGDAVGLTPEVSDVNLLFLLGILNSSLLDWELKKKSTVFRGGYRRYSKRYIENLNIILPNQKDQEKIIQTVKEIINLKKLQGKFGDIWVQYSKKYRKSYKTLGEILDWDRDKIRKGSLDETWTSDANIYPNGDNEKLDKEYDNFRISRTNEKILVVYGITGTTEEKILEMELRDTDLMEIIYLSIKELLDSRKKTSTLRDLFGKTEVSQITPNSWENSQNLIQGAKKKFEEWMEKEEIDKKESDPITIDEKIREIDHQIDAHVFKLYGLNQKEIQVVLNALGTIESDKNGIIEKFDRLDK